jgi:hypothetical protein
MSSSRRKRQRPDPPARGGIKPNKTILIVSEGTVTERQYVEGLAQHIGNAGVKVILSKKHGVPRTIVDAAKEERLELRNSYREDYDEIWCLFDRDRHPRFEESIQIALDRGYRLAVSSPCIELWLWLHHRSSPGAQTHTHMQEKLEQELDKDYDKSIRGDFYFPNLNVAVASAFRLDKEIREDGEPLYRNPSTGMYKLVLSMASKGDGLCFVDGFDWLARYQ